MQQIDKLFGPVICFIFSIFSRKNNGMLLKKLDIKNVLVIKFWGMGSIILLSPSVKMLKEKFPDVKITLLTLERNLEIANLLQVFDEIITLKLPESNFYFVMLEIFSLIKNLRKKVYDIIIDAEFFTRFSALITFFSKSLVKIGFHSWEVYRGNFYDITKPFNRYWHVRDNFLNLFFSCFEKEFIDFEIEKNNITFPNLNLSKEDEINLEKILTNYNVSKKDKIICINVHAGDLALERRWPKENFIKLTKEILFTFKDVKIIFIGSKNEYDYTQDIVKEINDSNAVNLSGKISLSQLVILLKNVQLFITNDSGPLHLADMLDVPTISFFGPETPVLYGPKSSKHIVLFKNIDCSPCINVHTGKVVKCVKINPECMKSITVEEVLNKIKRFL
jgi:heptosyltransferase-2